MSKKNIEINLTDGANYNAGQIGENKAVELFIHVPQDMYSLDHNYRLVFSNGVVTPMLQITPPGNDGEDGVIRYLLESELTSSSNLGMQLEEYGEDGLIDKSSVVSLKFGSSLSKQKEIFFNKDIILEINNNTIFAQKHQSTLDSLSVVDGKLFFDGSLIENVIVWKIKKDPVIPAEPDGTLLYTVYGENGLMNSDPYLVEIQGVLYKKPAPWKPGQLWVCRSGIWYLLTSESKTNFDPSEVHEGDIIEGGDDNIVWAPAPNPDDDALIVDGVKLLQFGVPLDLVCDKPETAHYYLAEENITTNRQYLIEVKTENANRSIRIACYNGMFSVVYDEFGVGKKYYQNGSWDVEPNLSAFKIESVKFNDTVTALSLDEIIANSDYLRMYTSFCQAFQSCAIKDFKRYPPIDGAYEALSDTVVCDGRVCVAKLNGNTTSIKTSRDRFLGTKDSYATVYVDCEVDVDVAFDADYYVGGEVPNTKTGRHKLIYNLLPDSTVSLGALDLEAVV